MIKNFQSALLLRLVEYDGLCRRPFTIYTLNWLIATNTWSATTDCERWESNPLSLGYEPSNLPFVLAAKEAMGIEPTPFSL